MALGHLHRAYPSVYLKRAFNNRFVTAVFTAVTLSKFAGGYCFMNVVAYAAFAYLSTALISLAVISIVVLINKMLLSFSKGETKGEE